MNRRILDTIREELKTEEWAYQDDMNESTWYVNDSTGVDTIMNFIERRIEELSNDVDSKRAHYFAMRDMLWANGGTGYSKVELHSLAKRDIFPLLVEEPNNFVEGGKQQKEFSVTWLSEKGWESYNEEFKLWAVENFNFYL